MKLSKTGNNVIHVTGFDLSVMEAVESIAAMQGIHKKIILRDLGIHHTAWAKMLKNERNVSTKADRQSEIISILKGKYNVDPDFIRHYPGHTSMFLKKETEANEDGTYRVKMHGSLRSLQKYLRECEREINKLLTQVSDKDAQIKILKEDLENARLLLKTLKKSAKNPAKTGKNEG